MKIEAFCSNCGRNGRDATGEIVCKTFKVGQTYFERFAKIQKPLIAVLNHIVCTVRKPEEEIGEKEILKRIAALKGEKYAKNTEEGINLRPWRKWRLERICRTFFFQGNNKKQNRAARRKGLAGYSKKMGTCKRRDFCIYRAYLI